MPKRVMPARQPATEFTPEEASRYRIVMDEAYINSIIPAIKGYSGDTLRALRGRFMNNAAFDEATRRAADPNFSPEASLNAALKKAGI